MPIDPLLAPYIQARALSKSFGHVYAVKGFIAKELTEQAANN